MSNAPQAASPVDGGQAGGEDKGSLGMRKQGTSAVKDPTTTRSPAPAKSTLRRFWRGLVCTLSFLFFPIGRLCRDRLIKQWNRNISIAGWY